MHFCEGVLASGLWSAACCPLPVGNLVLQAGGSRRSLNSSAAGRNNMRLSERDERILQSLREDAERVIELLHAWDEDQSGTTDRREFRVALPVLDLHVTPEEANHLFDWLLLEMRRTTAEAAASSEPASPDEEAPPITELEHWALFRLLASGVEGLDVDAAESAARESILSTQTRREVGESTFWTRDDGDGVAKNRHALRKRAAPIKGWNPVAAGDFFSTLGAHHTSSDAVDDEGPRVLQGTVLDSTASVQEQLCAALDRNFMRVTELFRAWDEDSDGRVGRAEFIRGVRLFGLGAPLEEIEKLYDSFDPNGDGSIEFGELNALLRKRVAEVRVTKKPTMLGSTSKWSKNTAKLLIGREMMDAQTEGILLREALSTNAESVINLFKR